MFLVKKNIIISLVTILCFVFLSINLKAEIIVNNWQEEITLTSQGKISNISFQAKATDLGPRSFHDSFGTIFDSRQKIKIISVFINNKTAKYLFSDNELKINFNKPLFNKKTANINYSYIELKDYSNQDIIQEFISVPKWVKNTYVKVIMNIPQNLQILTLHNDIKEIDNKLIYHQKIGQGGFSELIKLSPISKRWQVKIKSHISAKNKIMDLKIKIPLYFKNNRYQYDNFQITSKPQYKNIKTISKEYLLTYWDIKNNNTDINIDIEALIYSGGLNKINPQLNPQNYLKVSPKNKLLLSEILTEIKNYPQWQNLPTYAKIGNFTHNYIQYNKAYSGKLLNIEQIIKLKNGVCTEYAKLFNILARMAGIPSLIVSGMSKNDTDKFEGHSWNLIYYNNKWIEVDPTWGLMSGKVSSSHIYFYNEFTKYVAAEYKTNSRQKNLLEINTDFEVIPF